MGLKQGVCVVVLTLAGSACSEVRDGRWILEGFTGNSQLKLLGSEDPRTSRGIGLGVVLPGFKPLKLRGVRSETITLAYYHRSTSPGASQQPANGTDAYGVLSLQRYTVGRFAAGTELYMDIGSGLQTFDQRTVDLSARFAFTPTFGLGLRSKDASGNELTVGVRFMHLSNAGLAGNNQGQNQLHFTMGLRF